MTLIIHDATNVTASNLTIGDLERLKEAYCRVLLGTMHHRVRYPHEIATGIQFHLYASRASRAGSPAPGEINSIAAIIDIFNIAGAKAGAAK